MDKLVLLLTLVEEHFPKHLDMADIFHLPDDEEESYFNGSMFFNNPSNLHICLARLDIFHHVLGEVCELPGPMEEGDDYFFSVQGVGLRKVSRGLTPVLYLMMMLISKRLNALVVKLCSSGACFHHSVAWAHGSNYSSWR